MDFSCLQLSRNLIIYILEYASNITQSQLSAVRPIINKSLTF